MIKITRQEFMQHVYTTLLMNSTHVQCFSVSITNHTSFKYSAHVLPMGGIHSFPVMGMEGIKYRANHFPLIIIIYFRLQLKNFSLFTLLTHRVVS